MPMLVDTHCHLDEPGLSGRLEQVLSAANSAGVMGFIVPGVDGRHWDRIASVADASRGIYPAYGLHPMHAAHFTPALLDRLKEYLPQSVAVGEIGLDYHCTGVPREVQMEAFRQQLRLAVQVGLPVLIHCRQAFRDLMVILRQEAVHRVGGVMHAFSGSPEIAREAVGLGLLISVAGPVTYVNAVRPLQVAAQVPLGSLVLETDAPDLAPEPHRGEKNEPAFLPLIATTVARLRGVSCEEVEETTTANARRLFGI